VVGNRGENMTNLMVKRGRSKKSNQSAFEKKGKSPRGRRLAATP